MILDYIYIIIANDVVRWSVGATLTLLLSMRIVKAVWYIYCTSGCDSENSSKPLPPGTMGYPLVGETIQLALKNAAFYKEREALYGKVYKTHVLGNPTVRISGADNLRVVLTGENTIVTSQWPRSVRIIFGTGSLSMSDGDDHTFKKRLILKAFTHVALESYIPTIQTTMQTYLQRWRKKKEILAFKEIKDMALDLALKIFFGTEYSAEKLAEMQNLITTLVAGIFSLPYDIPGLGLNKGLKAKRVLLNEIIQVIDVIESEGSQQSFKSAIHHILDHKDHEKYTKYEMAEAIQELLFTGHDTVTSAMNSAVMFIGRRPDILQRLRQELDEQGILRCETACPLSLQTFTQLPYLLCVTREVLRVAPSAGAVYRKALKTFEVEGYRIPRGWSVAVGIRDTHHSSPIFTNPEEFNPDRWATLPNLDRQEVESAVDRFNYTPFGAGSRTCVGKEYAKLAVRLFLIELSRTSSWTLHNENPKMEYIPVPRPVDNLPITISAFTP